MDAVMVLETNSGQGGVGIGILVQCYTECNRYTD